MSTYVVYGPENGHYGTYDTAQRAKDIASRQTMKTGHEYGVRVVQE